MRLQHLLPLFLLSGSVYLTHPSFAKTIHVPTDAGSVKEAVEMAVSGDEIVLDATEVDWVIDTGQPIDDKYKGEGGIIVRNKDISISGRSSVNRTKLKTAHLYEMTSLLPNSTVPQASLLWIEDSTVTIRNIESKFDFWTLAPFLHIDLFSRFNYFAAPIYAMSGSITIEDSTIDFPIYARTSVKVKNSYLGCNTVSYGEPYWTTSTDYAGFHIDSATDIDVYIENSTIGHPYTYQTMKLSGLNNSRITIRNSTVSSGFFYKNDHTGYMFSPYPGKSAIHVQQCSGLSMNLHVSTIRGGSGYLLTESNPHPIAASGGPGLLVENSSISLLGGNIQGGNGFPGGKYQKDRYSYLYFYALSGAGGNGIELQRSHVLYQDVRYQGGLGGPEIIVSEEEILPAGQDGQPISMDEFSTFQEITALPDWSLY